MVVQSLYDPMCKKKPWLCNPYERIDIEMYQLWKLEIIDNSLCGIYKDRTSWAYQWFIKSGLGRDLPGRSFGLGRPNLTTGTAIKRPEQLLWI